MNVPVLNRMANHSPSAGQASSLGRVSGPRIVSIACPSTRDTTISRLQAETDKRRPRRVAMARPDPFDERRIRRPDLIEVDEHPAAQLVGALRRSQRNGRRSTSASAAPSSFHADPSDGLWISAAAAALDHQCTNLRQARAAVGACAQLLPDLLRRAEPVHRGSRRRCVLRPMPKQEHTMGPVSARGSAGWPTSSPTPIRIADPIALANRLDSHVREGRSGRGEMNTHALDAIVDEQRAAIHAWRRDRSTRSSRAFVCCVEQLACPHRPVAVVRVRRRSRSA